MYGKKLRVDACTVVECMDEVQGTPTRGRMAINTRMRVNFVHWNVITCIPNHSAVSCQPLAQ